MNLNVFILILKITINKEYYEKERNICNSVVNFFTWDFCKVYPNFDTQPSSWRY